MSEGQRKGVSEQVGERRCMTEEGSRRERERKLWEIESARARSKGGGEGARREEGSNGGSMRERGREGGREGATE